ncbi:MAG: exostosin family protein [Anaerolineales bacterium]|nr:exostosin family protein [Anaerolineales bacterium]
MQHPIHVFTDISHYQAEDRRYLSPIVRAHWNDKSPSERVEIYPARYTHFSFVDSIADADICILPMMWNYYAEFNKVDLAAKFVEVAHSAKRPVAVWTSGDFSLNVPFENVIKFEASLYSSRRKIGDFALPVMFRDYAALYFSDKIDVRPKQEKPVVGFCGHAKTNPLRLTWWGVRNLRDTLAYKLHSYKPYHYPLPLVPSVILRSKVLNRLAHSPQIETNFILRKRYRAGVTDQERSNAFHASRIEFVNNIYHSDYTVCIRGSGNFSQRFYETMCLGRIPIFVNTDSVLPYDFILDWKKHSIWVEQHEIKHIADIVADFHSRLSPDDFIELQRQSRQIWLDYLSQYGFHSQLYRHFDYFNEKVMEQNHVLK